MQVEVGVNVRVLMMMRRHIEHLQPGSRIGCHRGHPLRMKPLCSESLGVTQLRAQLRSCQRHPLPLQMVQPRMEGREGVRRPRYVRETQRSMSGKVLNGVGRGVQGFQVGRFDLEAGLHPLAEFPLSEVPQLALSEARLGAVQARHVVGQQRLAGAQGHVKRMVAVGGGHDVGSGVFTQGAQGRCVRADVRRHSCYSGGRLLKGGTPVALSCHLRVTHTAVMGGAGGSSISVGLPFSLSLSVFLPFTLLPSAELSLSPGLFHSLLSFLGQFGG